MAVEPLNRISLRATSLADDLGFVALADLARVLKPHDEVSYRVIGGQMVMVLAARWGLGADLYRVTLDADLGTPPVVVRDHTLVERLVGLDYRQVAGDRFAKPVGDTTTGDEGDTPRGGHRHPPPRLHQSAVAEPDSRGSRRHRGVGAGGRPAAPSTRDRVGVAASQR